MLIAAHEQGPGLLDYAVILGLLAIVGINALPALGGQVGNIINRITNELEP
jgi:Flp pilus assembly pilin Flp